jgi:Protein of unknown function (DUF4038)
MRIQARNEMLYYSMLSTPAKALLFLLAALSGLCFPPAAAAAEAQFPLRISSNHRYLVDQTGKPFLIHGDTPWSMFTYWSIEEADEYLKDRQEKGFNTLLVNILDDAWPVRVDGTPPFTKSTDFSTPNEAYFQQIDRVMQRASDLGFLVLACPVIWVQENSAGRTNYTKTAPSKPANSGGSWANDTAVSRTSGGRMEATATRTLASRSTRTVTGLWSTRLRSD